uniref:F-box protein CPR30-like n=1 Tax=Fragaria vesca subsp. vesca TaxID=101020 RepID=UPI0005C9397F|nr:PREDICTED: F-box protein CPR30-like [Fragaria vesca subsp. vesca]
MTGIDLPEDIIENIFSRLPVKTLIRFTCLSKKYHHLILKDPVFAKTQYKFASRHRLLISDPDLGSLDLDTPSFDDIRNDIRKPNFRFLPPNSGKYDIIPSSLGSCNGLMFVLVQGFFVCNPSTGFFKKLPFGGYHTYAGHYHGVGYLSTTDDYKVVGNHMVVDEEMSVTAQWVEIFSLRAKVWKRMKKT